MRLSTRILVTFALMAWTQNAFGLGIAVSPSRLNFPSQYLNTTSVAKIVTVKNVGTNTLTITASISGTNSGDFSIASNNCGNLAPGATCKIGAAFRPTAVGNRSGMLNVNDSDGGSTPVSLKGVGTNIRLSPAALDFGTAQVGTTTPAKTLTLQNQSTNTLNISSVTVNGTDFSIPTNGNKCVGSLPPGRACKIAVVFTPTTSNIRSAVLSVNDDGIGSPQTANLTGKGTFVTLSPSSLDFGSWIVGSTSSPQTITLTNHNSVALTITSIAITGTNSSDFGVVSQNCGNSVPAGGSCGIDITFGPTTIGLRIASLRISDDGGASPQIAPLKGTGFAPVCGNAVREPGEQCDDGNTTNLDGCSATCRFEQNQRINYLKIMFNTDTTCTSNAFGGAFASTAQSQQQASLDNGIKDGSISLIYTMLGITDLSGTNEPSFSIGEVPGTPVIPPGKQYDGSSDLDWWYTADPNSLDSNRVPLEQIPASITSNSLAAGPGPMILPFSFGATAPVQLRLSNTVVRGLTNTVSTPLVSSDGMSPGHAGLENLDPTLMSYQLVSHQTDVDAGSMCGGISAASLQASPVPAIFLQGSLACHEGYTATNSMLDVIVGGCIVSGFNITEIVKTQPDTADPNAPVLGAGPPYKLSADGQRHVTACSDKNGGGVPLSDCLDAAAYSSYFKLATGRTILK